MADLAALYADIEIAVGQFLGYGGAPSGAAPDGNQARVDQIIARGYRMFLNPPPLPGETYNHQWSFLQRTDILTTIVKQTSSTITYTDSSRNCLIAAGTWPTTVVSHSITFTNQTFGILTRTDSTNAILELGDGPGADQAAGTTYVLDSRNMDLPADFGYLKGNFTFTSRTGYPPISLTSVQRIEELRQNDRSVQYFRPRLAAVRSRVHGVSTDQRWEVMFWPIPDAAYNLIFSYAALPAVLDSTSTTPLGEGFHSETIMAACLAKAEEILDQAPTVYRKRELFIEHLKASVMLDRQTMSAPALGYNADNSDSAHRAVQPFLDAVSVGGITYPT